MTTGFSLVSSPLLNCRTPMKTHIKIHPSDHVAVALVPLVRALMRCTDLWGQDLTEIPGFLQAVTDCPDAVHRSGTYEVMRMSAGL